MMQKDKRTTERPGRNKSRRLWGAAACVAAALALAAGFRFLPPSDLPMLTISEDQSPGYEGYMAFDISELTSANPWYEGAELDTLPVYRASGFDSFAVQRADLEPLWDFAYSVADSLHLERDRLTPTVYVEHFSGSVVSLVGEMTEAELDSCGEGQYPTFVNLRGEGVEISVDVQDLWLRVAFDPGLPLPEGYRFSGTAPYAEQERTAQYLREAYRDLLGMEEPRTVIEDGDYHTDRMQHYEIAFYEGKGSLTDQILQYNLCPIRFLSDGEGRLGYLHIRRPALPEKLGDYPIISPEEARQLLCQGYYLSDVPYAFPGEEAIRRLELVYRTESWKETLLPYYRFLAELPGSDGLLEEGDDLLTYGAYYVPAVEGRYLTNMPERGSCQT